MNSKRHRRYKLLFDEGLPLPRSYPDLNKLHSLTHIAQSKNRGKSDRFIFRLAEKHDMLPVVFNTKHFKPLITQNSISLISLSTSLTNKEADLKICKALKEIKTSQLKGHLISISKSGIEIKHLGEYHQLT